MSSGDLLSCGRDNHGGQTSLCFTGAAEVYKLWDNVSTSNGYYADDIIILTFRVQNLTAQAFATEAYVNLTFPGFESLDLWLPVGCGQANSVGFNTGTGPFYLKSADGCIKAPAFVGGAGGAVRWHACASDVHCPYDPIFNDYAQFGADVGVPENRSVSFSFSAMVTVGAPTTCCLNDLLATSKVSWSQQSGSNAISEPPPPTGFGRFWPFIIAGLAGVAVATPTVLAKVPAFLRSNRKIVARPVGIRVLSILLLIQGFAFTLGATRMLVQSLSVLTVASGTIDGHPYWTLALGIFGLFTGIGSWNGREWARELDILGAVLLILASVVLVLFAGPSAILFFGALLVALYIVSYLQSPQVKAFFLSSYDPV